VPDVFLSYSREDQAVARRFAEAFERAGLSVWWDQALSAGEAYDKVTETALREARAVVVLWSRHSVESRWVRSEATMADRNGTLVPVMIEECTRPIMFELTQTADLSGWKGDEGDRNWQSLLSSVRRFVEKGGARATAAGPPAIATPSRPGRRGAAWAAVAAALVLVAIALWLFRKEPPVASGAGSPSIAVLPFTNLSSDKEQEYFSDGLSEELLNQLTQVPGLRVIGRTSSFAFKGRNEDLRKIGELLGVNHILEGSVRKSGNRVRINAQLINPADGSNLWSETYERTLDDIFAMQDEIAQAVAKELKLKLGVQDLNASGTKNVAAFDAFLAGRALLNSSGANSMNAAVPLLERAVSLDPAYVPARLWLIDAYTRLLLGSPDPSAEITRRQDEIIDQVLRQVPGTPEASLALSYRVARGGDLRELERLLQDALRLSGGSGARARLRYGQFLAGVGQAGRSITEMEQAQQNEPLDVFGRMNTLLGYEIAGRFDRAEQESRQLLQLPGGQSVPVLGTMVTRAMSQRDTARLRQLIPELERLGPDGVNSAANLRQLVDDPEVARRQLREQIAASGGSGDIYALSSRVQSAAYLGDRDLALSAMEALFGRSFGFETVAFVFWRPVLRDLRGEPRFKEQLRKIGLVDYWRSTGNWGDFCKPAGQDDFECR
jgi:TolB-like protein